MAETLVEAWATLKNLYETKNTALILTLQYLLDNMDMKEGNNVHDHVTKVKVVRDKFTATGHMVDSAPTQTTQGLQRLCDDCYHR